ncbi:Beta-defensin 125, partial [Lemmus lemmus]
IKIFPCFVFPAAEINIFPCFVFPAAGWSQPKCWKNNLGHCRVRCLYDERYILLCKNKASCCIPLALMKEKHPRPQPSLTFPEDVTFPNSFSASLNTKFNDEVTFKGDESKEMAGTPSLTPMRPTHPKPTAAVSAPKD